MILGSDDPAAPPQYGEAALQDLPNGRAVLVKGAGHGADNACTDRLVLAFLRADSAKDLNVSQCGPSFKQPPFATSMKGWP
jgi:pimeloyl-ACP methyl ester carboxylesterase